jgi:hypothetical protein
MLTAHLSLESRTVLHGAVDVVVAVDVEVVRETGPGCAGAGVEVGLPLVAVTLPLGGGDGVDVGRPALVVVALGKETVPVPGRDGVEVGLPAPGDDVAGPLLGPHPTGTVAEQRATRSQARIGGRLRPPALDLKRRRSLPPSVGRGPRWFVMRCGPPRESI